MKSTAANKNVLKKYLYNVYKLEVSLYNQKNLWCNIDRKIREIKNEKAELLYEERSTKRILGDVWEDVLEPGLGAMAIGVVVTVLVRAIYSCIDVGFFADLFTGRLFGWLFQFALIGAIGGLILYIIFTLCHYFAERKRIISENREIQIENAQIEANNQRKAIMNNRKLNILTSEQNRIYSAIEETTAVLNKYYSYNIIFPKYRHLEAVSSFYEYFASGICSTLEGHEGAYNTYENELRQGIIINKLDNIIEHLEQLESNQYMLYTAITEGNRQTERMTAEICNTANQLSQIENNTAVTAYYSKIGAQNTECLKWIAIFNR